MLPVREQVQGLGEQNNFLLNGDISLWQTVEVEDTSLWKSIKSTQYKFELLKLRKCNTSPTIFTYDSFKERELKLCQCKWDICYSID